MTISVRAKSYTPILLLFSLSLFPIWLAYSHSVPLTDDSYITLTFAKNIAHGNGFVYNHPPSVQGTTTPLLTLIIAMLGSLLLTTPIHLIATLFSALCWIGMGWLPLIFRRTWALSTWQATLLGANLMISSAWPSTLGMEVYLFGFLLILSACLFYAKYYLATGFCIGLLFLTRGEGILVGVMLGLLLVIWNRRSLRERRWKEFAQDPVLLAVGFILPVGLWFLYAFQTFGTLLPNTLVAKQAQGEAGIMGNLFIERLANEWFPMWGRQFRLGGFSWQSYWWIYVGAGVIISFVYRRQWLLFLGWIITFILGYTLLQVTGYWWYQYPVIHVLNIFFSVGVALSIEMLDQGIQTRLVKQWLIGCLIILNLGLLSEIVWRTTQNHEGDSRAQSYVVLSNWFNENTDPSDSIGSIEIGYLGYYTQNQIIDLAGLIIPEIVPHISEGDFAWGFWEYEPDYFVYLPDFEWALGTIRSDQRFAECYAPAVNLPGPQEAEFTIFKNGCNDE